MNCGSCGAQISATDLNCQYCGVVTHFGAHQRFQHQQQQAHLELLDKQREQHEDAQRSQTAVTSLKRTANFSLYWGLAGLLLCCAFVPSVIAMVLGIRARKLASKYHLVLPVNATIGLLLGLLGLATGVLVIAFAIADNAEKDERIAQIDRELMTRNTAQLSPDVACLLVERRLLKNGFGKDSRVRDPECIGKLSQDGETATLEDIQFKASSKRVSARACFTYGARWSVSGFRLQNDCSAADDTAAPDTK